MLSQPLWLYQGEQFNTVPSPSLGSWTSMIQLNFIFRETCHLKSCFVKKDSKNSSLPIEEINFCFSYKLTLYVDFIFKILNFFF